MKFEYTFKDGVTVPMRLVMLAHKTTTTHGSNKELRRIIEVHAVGREYVVEDDERNTIDESDAAVLPEMVSAIFRKLQEITSAEFIENPKIGLGMRVQLEVDVYA